MSTPSFRDYELLSAYLDRELNQKEKARLVARIVKEPELARALEELRQTRAMLRRTPQRKAPRNFTLTPRMVGIRPPVPRVVPALSWASAVAMVMFVLTLGYNLLTTAGSFGAAAPKAADTYGNRSVAATMAPAATQPPSIPQSPATQPPATQPPATQAPVQAPPAPAGTATAGMGPMQVQGPTPTIERTNGQGLLPGASTPTPESTSGIMSIQSGGGTSTSETLEPTSTQTPEATAPAVSDTGPAGIAPAREPKALPWIYIWLGLAAVLILAALLVRWLSRLAFARKEK